MGAPIIDLVKTMAAPNAMENWVTLAHPMASKVGWFGVNNISCGLFSIPAGFVTIWIVSLLTPAPSKAVMDMVDAVRRPRGEMFLKDKDAVVAGH